MLKKLKILFIDLDGTTLDKKQNGQWTISTTNKQAITKARKKGLEVVISTGRIGIAATSVFKLIGGNYCIQGNGSLITNNHNGVVFEKKLLAPTVLKIINFAQKHKLIAKLSFDDQLYGVTTIIKKIIASRFGLNFIPSYNYEMGLKRHKVLLFGALTKWRTKRLGQALINQFPDLTIAIAGKGFGIEITAPQASKGHAASFIAKHLNVKKSQIAHIGDEMNDATTKNHVGTLIVMKNGNKKIKAIANLIAPNHKHGGLAQFLEANKYFTTI